VGSPEGDLSLPRKTAIAERRFEGVDGTEHYLLITPAAEGDFAAQLGEVEAAYGAALRTHGLSPASAVFRRIFVSDILNQMPRLRESPLLADGDDPVAVSVVQQPPLPRAKLALLAYHVSHGDGLRKQRLSPHHVMIEKNGRRHLWSTGLCAAIDHGSVSPERQTRAVFDELTGALAGQGASLRDHCVRTWIYLKDVDVFYQGMVESRRALFAEHGLTEKTHYIASTGIEGACAHRFDVVAMDAYSLPDLRPEQMSYLNDFDRLCPTRDYGVTFERGTRITYADRAHHFISGTASIDQAGQVVHRGDVLRQFDRAVENVAALLRSGGATLDDLSHLIVYLRDPADCPRIEAAMRERLGDLPALIVQGPVCRPDWLVEIEGIGIARHADPALPAF